MSQLAACNGKAKNTVGDATRPAWTIRTWTRYVTSSHRTVNSSGPNAPPVHQRVRTALHQADKATKRTRTLAGKVDRLVKAKPLMDARRKCRDALDKAVKASTDAKPSDDATRAAKATLDKLIGQARKLDAKTTVHVERHGIQARQGAREPLPGVDAKAKADEEARRQAEAQAQAQQQARNSNSRRCPRRRRSTAALPAQAPPACRKATAEEPRTTTMAEHPTATPAMVRATGNQRQTVCRANDSSL